ncbi:MAG: peptidyl-prolyl cis-trans isomerase [Syntrophomonadaceae bacterium]
MKRRFLPIMVILALLLSGCQSAENTVIGEVNGEKITKKQFEERYNIVKTSYESKHQVTLDKKKDSEVIKSLQDQTFDELVLQYLIVQETEKNGITVSESEVDTGVSNLKEYYEKQDKDGFENFLRKTGYDEKSLREELKNEQLFSRLYQQVTSGIIVDESQAKEFYDKNADKFVRPESIQISHIVVKTEEEAQDLLKQLKEGEDFAELAREHSLCPSASEGGNLGLLNDKSSYVPEFKNAALLLKAGETTQQPVKTEFGYHIIKAGQKEPARSLSFEEVKDQIITELQKEKETQVFLQYIQEVKGAATIVDNRKE